MSGPQVRVFDNLLAPADHAAIWAFLNQGGWSYGGFSADGPEADRYFYKHFAGYRNDGREARDLAAIEGGARPRPRRCWPTCGPR